MQTHYIIFNLFYYATLEPCLGIKSEKGIRLMFDSTKLLFTGNNIWCFREYL